WDVRTGVCLQILLGHTNRVCSVAFSPTERILASSSDDRTVRLWDTSNGECLKVLPTDFMPVQVAFSADGALLALAGADPFVRLWDVATSQELRSLAGHSEPVFSVMFSDDGRLLISGSADRTARLWDARRGACLSVLE